MLRKSIFTPSLALVVSALALAGCSNNPSADGEQTLTMFAASDFKASTDTLIADFEAANPGVKIQVTYASGNDFETTEGTAISSGNPPDIIDALAGITGPIATQQLITDGVVLDLSNESWAKDVPESINSENQPDLDDKGVYFYPVLVQPMGAFYNEGTLQEAGLEVPSTWSEVLQFCEEAQKAGKIPYSLGLSDQWVGQLVPYSLADTLLYGDDPSWGKEFALSEGRVSYTDSPWVEVFEKYKEMGDAGCFTENPNAVALDATLGPVANGDAVGIVQVGGLFENLSSLNPDATYVLDALPATDNPEETYMPASPSHQFAVSAESPRKDLALKFLDFLAQPENINKFVITAGGAVPAIPNDTFEAPKLLENFNEYVTEGKTRAFPFSPNVEVQNELMVGTQNMFLGEMTPVEVVEGMQAAIR